MSELLFDLRDKPYSALHEIICGEQNRPGIRKNFKIRHLTLRLRHDMVIADGKWHEIDWESLSSSYRPIAHGQSYLSWARPEDALDVAMGQLAKAKLRLGINGVSDFVEGKSKGLERRIFQRQHRVFIIMDVVEWNERLFGAVSTIYRIMPKRYKLEAGERDGLIIYEIEEGPWTLPVSVGAIREKELNITTEKDELERIWTFDWKKIDVSERYYKSDLYRAETKDEKLLGLSVYPEGNGFCDPLVDDHIDIVRENLRDDDTGVCIILTRGRKGQIEPFSVNCPMVISPNVFKKNDKKN